MTLGVLVGAIMKTSALTILGEIAMKAIDQQDFARLIKFTGISQISTDVVAYIHYLEQNPPLLLRMTKQSFEGWKDFLGLFGVGK